MYSRLPQHNVVLLGAGHTNAHVLRMWRMQPVADARLTVVSNHPLATYSGMLPGTLAGLYPPERMQIDLVRLCAAAGARLLLAEATGLDLAARRLLLADRPPLDFDLLSIGIGSVPQQGASALDPATVLTVKPMQTFLARLDERLERLRAAVVGRPLRVAVVGGGAGGTEIALCLPGHLQSAWPGAVELALVDAAPRLLADRPAAVARRAEAVLQRRGVQVYLGQTVREVAAGKLSLANGEELPIDLAIWATGAAAPPALAGLDLPKDERGFLLTRPTLQTVADSPVFAVGDAGTIQGQPTAKAGVYAVRQGPVLWENVGRMLRGEPLVEYEPQRGFLSLLATGDRRAILSYKGLCLEGAWCWRLKDYIDGRFMDKYQDYRPLPMAHVDSSSNGQAPMRCAGCGGKVGSTVLARVLARLEIPAAEHVLLGLEQPDDAAIVQSPGGRPLVVTADFFAAFMDDPYLVGRVAALNAASDLFALGSRPLAALALATIPLGPSRAQEELLYELLAGGLAEFRRMGATLVGGHTIEGPQTTIGYTMLADAGTGQPRVKGALRAADRLVLTKPLGSGVLLAAHGQARMPADAFAPLVDTLLASNQAAAGLLDEFDIAGVTDITGFGLAGHLGEMLRASGLAADLRLAALPTLPCAEELAAAGVESTLAPANRAVEAQIEAPFAAQRTPRYALLFDPQTSGGLLLGVPAGHTTALIERLHALGYTEAAELGEVVPPRVEQALIRVLA
jgi:selenide,water dikinase